MDGAGVASAAAPEAAVGLMPIYEFGCGACGRVSEVLLPVSRSGDREAACRGCGGVAERRVSAPRLGIFRPHFNRSLGIEVRDYTDWREGLKVRGLEEIGPDDAEHVEKEAAAARREISERQSAELTHFIRKEVQAMGVDCGSAACENPDGWVPDPGSAAPNLAPAKGAVKEEMAKATGVPEEFIG